MFNHVVTKPPTQIDGAESCRAALVKKKCIFIHEALVDTRNSDKPIDIFQSPSSSTTSSVHREPGTFTSTHPISLKLSTSVYAGSPSPVSLPQFENAILKRKKLTLIWALRLSPP
ncbi:hypothetical protein K435DRAFT_426156 [Dendrothele bispora CBS 962.96]|uniref:Uncharacterized protein n=1 Tax=Dendrothele bispora (strain CBS 962.96) TaxID=1314807 RepID=A0A4S8L566_DENBC|nr:hypothetical protein K435DRAFT_426156 [Dendrothele bispora CBS 962.96]